MFLSVQSVVKTTRYRVRVILDAFLPAGFPHTVTNDYLRYQLFDSLQAFSSSIASLLANRAVLQGLGVGNAGSNATNALLVTIIQEICSRLACILFAHRLGQSIEPECKKYRFLADIFNDSALCLDLLAPLMSTVPKVFIMSTASMLRALCGVAAGASKATLSAHFAKNGNLAELNAKEASQETVISLMGMLAGTVLVHYVHDGKAVWVWMAILIAIHLGMNYQAVCSVEMETLNKQRAVLLYRAFCEGGKRPESVLTPKKIAKKENILVDMSYSDLPMGVLKKPVFAKNIEHFLREGGDAAIRALVENDRFHLGFRTASLTHSRDTSPIIMLEEIADGQKVAEAFFLNLYGGKEKKDDVYILTQVDMEVFSKGLIAKGWKFDPVALLARRTTRLGMRSDKYTEST